MAQSLDNDKMTLDIQNQDINKIQSKKNNLEQSAMSAFNDIDTEIKFERLKREELQDLQELMQVKIKKAVEGEQKQEKDCVKNEIKAETKEIIKKM